MEENENIVEEIEKPGVCRAFYYGGRMIITNNYEMTYKKVLCYKQPGESLLPGLWR